MSEQLHFHFDVDGDNFASAGQASVQVKKDLRRLGLSPETMDSSFRISLSRDNTEEELDTLVLILKEEIIPRAR